jgi:hypothetical protein
MLPLQRPGRNRFVNPAPLTWAGRAHFSFTTPTGRCGSLMDILRRTTINTLWEHYSQEELPLKALSTQDAYIMYAKNWIVPRWGNLPLEPVKTVEVER